MTFAFVPSDEVARVRSRLDHPVIDADGHLLEYLPAVRDNVVDLAGESVAQELDLVVNSGRALLALPPGDERRRAGRYRNSWWGVPTRNTLDRATAMLPQLLYRRLDELGIDFALLYPTAGLIATAYPREELRRALARACNRYYAEAYGEFRDRLEPVACVPCFTPDEALDELDHAVQVLGLKAVMLAGVIPRPFPGLEESPARWMDTLGHDSPFDYEPLWARCDELGVAVTFHSSGLGWGSRMSTTNYMYNPIGNFAAAGEAAARSLFFGGVPRRHPSLRFAFQEGGVAVAASLFADVLGHWTKRNAEAISHYDPEQLDRGRLEQLVEEFANGPVRERRHRLGEGLNLLSEPEPDRSLVDEFADSGVTTADDIVDVFTRQYFFGCEADDPMNALAFDRRIQPHGSQLRAVFASDIGHWDVPDFREVLPEAYELVADGHLGEDDFRAFTFANAVSLFASGNPAFFEGTAVADAAAAELRRG
jgi:predicted TIM-barrel fold metal-dependent hydrolase